MILLLILFCSLSSWAQSIDEDFLKNEIQKLEELQEPDGAFYPINCLDKAMTKLCYADKSLFFTGLIAESFANVKDKNLKEIKNKTINYLATQFKEQGGTVRYYETKGRLYPIVKPDVDDNGIVLSVMMDHPDKADQKLISHKIHELYNNSKISHEFFRKGSNKKESFTGEYLSTWVNPTKPFFNDIDLVVNFNGILAFAKHNNRSHEKEKIDLTSVCSTVNKIIDWSSKNEFEDLVSIRHWTRRIKSNYSQWYPSKYAVMLAVVRAHLEAGDASCIKSSYQLIRTHLLNANDFKGNVYDLALATTALARILKHENLPKVSLQTLILKLHDQIEKNKLGKDPFFFYGAVGYTGSIPILRTLLIEATSIYLSRERGPASTEIEEKEFLQKILSEQMDDGSFTALIKPSSPLYNIFVVFMYEYLGKTEEKKHITKPLIEHIFSMQKESGALAGYPAGPDHSGISTAGYTAAKIAGYDENDPRMLKLEKRIHELGGAMKSDMLTMPFLMMFSLFPFHSTFNTDIDRLMLKFNERMPWVKVLIHPVLFMLDNGHNHILSAAKYPGKIFKQPYEKYVLRSGKPKTQKDDRFLQWILNNINPDGTFFDYTPTTVPMLMALSSYPDQKATIEKGIATIESFQEKTPQGHLLQTPGEASVGETFYVANVLLDLGFDPEHRTIKKAEKYLLEHQLKTGGWGFSKNSVHFADSDDTSNAMYLMIRLDKARGKDIRPEVFKALDWLLTLQNRDGGFGTWESTKGRIIGNLINKVANSKGLVMSESVFEHTARIVVCLSLLKNLSPEAEMAYNKAIKWLLKQQNKDGSFAGTWFVDYMFSTSMAMTALGTNDSAKTILAIQKGISYLQSVQSEDGGFGESPDSFLEGKAIQLPQSSWAQTGLIVAQLHTMNAMTGCKLKKELRGLLGTTHLYLRDEKANWTQGMDPTWTAVTFPKVEYLIYPYIQRLVPWQAYNMHLTSNCH